MTFGYFASFDTADYRNDFGTVTFTCAGEDPIEINVRTDLLYSTAAGSTAAHPLATTVYNHLELGGTVSDDASAAEGLSYSVAFRSFGDQFTQLMVQAAYAASWPDFASLYCYLSSTTQRYTFGYSGGELTAITFSNPATRALFGFASDFSGTDAAITGTRLPDFIILPTLSSTSVQGADGFDYEPAGISMSSLSAAGHKVGFTRTSVPRYRDWFQQCEVKAKVLRASAVDTHPMTHQRLFELGRCVHPFVVTGGGFDNGPIDRVFRLRPDSCMWTAAACKRAGGDADDGLFDVHYRAQLLGALPFTGGG